MSIYRHNEAIPNVLNNRYHYIKMLGEGRYSIVYLARDAKDNDKEVAVKILKRANAEFQRMRHAFTKEYDILYELNAFSRSRANRNTDFVEAYEINELQESNVSRPYIVLENVGSEDWKSLRYLVGKRRGWLLEEEYRTIWPSLAELLLYMHEKRIAYVDFDLDHIFWDGRIPPKIKLIDFNGAKRVSNNEDIFFQRDIFRMGKLALEVLTGTNNSDSKAFWSKDKDYDYAKLEKRDMVEGITFPIDFGAYVHIISINTRYQITRMLNSIKYDNHSADAYSSAHELWMELEKWKSQPTIYKNQKLGDGLEYIKQGDFENAFELLNHALDENPEESMAIKLLTLVRLIRRSINGV